MSVSDGTSRTAPHLSDETTFRAFYSQNWLPMVRLANFLLDEPAAAEDVVQDAFVSLHAKTTTIRDSAAAVAYLRVSVVNGARSVMRRRILARRHAHPGPEAHSDSADARILADPANSTVVAAMRKLPRRQREVLVLRYWADLPFADVAQTLGVSLSTAKSTASRALDALERLLEDQS